MKRILILLFLLPTSTFAQRIVEDKIDEFTKSHKVYTSWERLLYNFDGNSFYRFRKIDSLILFDFKYQKNGNVQSIPTNASFYFKLSNDSIIELKCIEGVVSGKGDGAIGISGSGMYGLNAKYKITRNEIEKLKIADLSKVRFYLRDSYIEFEVNKKYSTIFKAALILLNEW